MANVDLQVCDAQGHGVDETVAARRSTHTPSTHPEVVTVIVLIHLSSDNGFLLGRPTTTLTTERGPAVVHRLTPGTRGTCPVHTDTEGPLAAFIKTPPQTPVSTVSNTFPCKRGGLCVVASEFHDTGAAAVSPAAICAGAAAVVADKAACTACRAATEAAVLVDSLTLGGK